MRNPVTRSHLSSVLTIVLACVATLTAQTPRKRFAWPPQVVLVRDEVNPLGSLGHLLVNGKEVAKTFEPHGERAQITVSRAHVHYSSDGSREDYAIVLDDLEDGDSGKKLAFHLGSEDSSSEGCVLVGTGYEQTTVILDAASEDGKKVLAEIEHEKGAGKQLQYEVDGNTLKLTVAQPVGSQEALTALRRALYGAADPGEKDLLVNFDFRASDEYKAQVLGISESIARQLTIDEKRFVIKAMEVPSEATGTGSAAATATKPGADSTVDPKTGASVRIIPEKPGDEHNSVQQGFKRSAEPDQPTTLDNKSTPPAQQTEKKKPPPD